MKRNYTIQHILSALFLMLLSAALISSCGKDDDLGIGDNPTEGNASGGNGTSDGAEGNKPSDTTEEDISFEDADVWIFFKINEGGQSASAVSGYYDSPYNDRNRWAGKVVIPSTVAISGKEYSVTGIADNAFRNCKYMTAIKIPETVTSIGDCAFQDCNSLTYIKIAESVTSIGDDAFRDCSSLTSISIPEGVTSIGDDAFRDCSSLTSISIPEGVTSIGYYAFWYCSSLTSITVAANNPVYDSREGCNAIIETSSNTLIWGCQNTIIPESVTSIGDWAFYGSSLTSISIPESVTSIGWYAFYDCSSLTSISISEGVTSIGWYAFYRCSSLTSVICYAEHVPWISSNAFDNVPLSRATLYVPASALEKYKASATWKKFGTILPIEE